MDCEPDLSGSELLRTAHVDDSGPSFSIETSSERSEPFDSAVSDHAGPQADPRTLPPPGPQAGAGGGVPAPLTASYPREEIPELWKPWVATDEKFCELLIGDTNTNATSQLSTFLLRVWVALFACQLVVNCIKPQSSLVQDTLSWFPSERTRHAILRALHNSSYESCVTALLEGKAPGSCLGRRIAESLHYRLGPDLFQRLALEELTRLGPSHEVVLDWKSHWPWIVRNFINTVRPSVWDAGVLDSWERLLSGYLSELRAPASAPAPASASASGRTASTYSTGSSESDAATRRLPFTHMSGENTATRRATHAGTLPSRVPSTDSGAPMVPSTSTDPALAHGPRRTAWNSSSATGVADTYCRYCVSWVPSSHALFCPNDPLNSHRPPSSPSRPSPVSYSRSSQRAFASSGRPSSAMNPPSSRTWQSALRPVPCKYCRKEFIRVIIHEDSCVKNPRKNSQSSLRRDYSRGHYH